MIEDGTAPLRPIKLDPPFGSTPQIPRAMPTRGIPKKPKGRTMMKPLFRLDPACSGALSGRMLFGDGFPMALPWAARKVPLAGRQIAHHPENSYTWYDTCTTYPSGCRPHREAPPLPPQARAGPHYSPPSWEVPPPNATTPSGEWPRFKAVYGLAEKQWFPTRSKLQNPGQGASPRNPVRP